MVETAKNSTVETDMGACGFMAAFFPFKRLKQKNVILLHNQDSPDKNNQLTITSKSAKPRHSSQARKIQPQKPSPSNYTIRLDNVLLSGRMAIKRQGQFGKNIDSEKPARIQLGNILHGPKALLKPDALKLLGNEKYKEGKYEEALALYDQAISIDPNRACYYGNKSAALIGLSRLVEAVFQGREAVRIDSTYHNAHFRLAKLYLRLGVAEEAVQHYKWSGQMARPGDITQAINVKNCLRRCIESKNNGDWKTLLGESQLAISLGADSAPQIYTMKAEALMELHRHQEAFSATQNSPHFGIKLYTEFLGSSATAAMLRVRALVYMANGRFEDAVKDIGQALRLSLSESTRLTAEKVKLVASARLKGNQLFKESRSLEALVEYNKGLEVDRYNSVLLCNRAACRFKLRQYEKAVEDCTHALVVRPAYSKARLRRANCHAQLEKWEAAIEDYELVMREVPGDQTVRAALLEAKRQHKKKQKWP